MTIDKKPKREKSEYDEQAENFLKETGTTFKAEFLRHGLYFDDKEGYERDIYQISLTRGARTYSFTFGQSIANSGRYTYYSSEKGKLVSNDKKQINKMAGRPLSLGEMSINNEQQPPTPYDVLASMQKYEVGTFKDFCDEFGYDEDSIKAEKTYKAVVEEYNNLKMLYSDEELEKMQDIN